MASSTELAPLHKTVDALKEIRKQIQPFLRVIESSESVEGNDDSTSSTTSSKHDPHTVAEARTAVALAVGTLRHMGARMGGRGGGGTGDKNDPLRLELDRMRKMLVTLRKVDKRGDTNKTTKQSGNNNGMKKKSTSDVNKDSKSEGSKKSDEVASKSDTGSDMNSSPNKDQKRKKKESDDSSGKKKRRKMN